jgi:hypothetical protein
MASSEDYLDNLLKSMGVPTDVATAKKTSDNDDVDSVSFAYDPGMASSPEIEEINEKQRSSDVFVDHSADIPVKSIIEDDPAASALHIDSAPSLDMNAGESSDNEDLSDLMSDLLGKFDNEQEEPDKHEYVMPEHPKVPLPEPQPQREVITSEKYSVSDNPGEDLDSQIAALLSESGITLSEEEGLKIDPSFSKSTAPVSSTEDYSSFDLDAELADLMKEENESADLPGEDDIEAMLNKARSEGLADDPDRSEMSLDELLAADSGSAAEIAALLSKNENNEAVDPGIEELLNGKDEPAPDIFSDDNGDNEQTADHASDKKRLKEEKKEARRKAKEAKKAEKAAKKAKKTAEKDAYDNVGSENELSFENIGNADMSDVDALLASAAEAAEESKAASLSSGNVPIPREARVNDQTADEADSLLAEIMGGSFGDNEQPSEEEPKKEEPQVLSEAEIDNILDKESSGKNKKKGLFARLLSMLTDEDEDEEDERSSLKLSDENAAVLDQLDAEGDDGKGKKKKKKKKKKDAAPEADNGEESGEEAEGKGKKAKKKKVKKEKAPAEDEKPAKKLNVKKVVAVFGLCFTILLAVLIISRLMGSYTVKKEAREAYAVGDYQTAYQDLFGQSLNESDEIIFKKSECILRIRLWLREYEILKEESDIKALDSLIQTVSRYPGLYDSAVRWNCLDDVEPLYRQMVDALWTEYGLTEDQAKEIAMLRSDVDYTRAVYAVVNGLNNNSEPEETLPEVPLSAPDPALEDELPGESDPGSDTVFVNP